MTGQVALRWLLAAMAVLVAVLLVTGLYLIWNYRAGNIPYLDFGGVAPVDALPDRMRDVHRWSSSALLVLAVATTVLAFVTGLQDRHWGRAVIGGTVVLLAFAGGVSGRLLPYDQIALTKVTVGTDMQGFDVLTEDDVRYLLVDGHEISFATFAAWFRVHTIVIPILLVALGIVMLMFSHRPRVEA
jgi:quinol-cytochrome oxidoreductase complex cytochrome b subunit